MKKNHTTPEFIYWEGSDVSGKKIYQITRHDEPKPVTGVHSPEKLLDRHQAPAPPNWPVSATLRDERIGSI